MLTTEVSFDTRLYLQSGQRKGEIALYSQSNYPGSHPKLLGIFTEGKDGILLIREKDSNVKLGTVADLQPAEADAEYNPF